MNTFFNNKMNIFFIQILSILTILPLYSIFEDSYLSFTLVTLGLYPHSPAHSCKEIRDVGGSRNDGKYWIDPEKKGNPLKVYCDMTTDGGRLRYENLIDAPYR